jgi:hypothetical protein
MGVDLQPLTSGCCGMAGSFGFESDKYDVSVAVGEHSLLPTLRKTGLSTVILADGFSCREQVSQLTDRVPLHLAEVMQLAIEDGSAGVGGILPERRFVREHEAAIRRSKKRAGLLLGGLAAAAGVGLWLARRD